VRLHSFLQLLRHLHASHGSFLSFETSPAPIVLQLASPARETLGSTGSGTNAAEVPQRVLAYEIVVRARPEARRLLRFMGLRVRGARGAAAAGDRDGGDVAKPAAAGADGASGGQATTAAMEDVPTLAATDANMSSSLSAGAKSPCPPPSSLGCARHSLRPPPHVRLLKEPRGRRRGTRKRSLRSSVSGTRRRCQNGCSRTSIWPLPLLQLPLLLRRPLTLRTWIQLQSPSALQLHHRRKRR